MIQIIKGDTLNFLPTRTMVVVWLLKTRTLRKEKLRWEKLGVAYMLLKVHVLTNLRGRRSKGIFSLSLHTSYILKNRHIKDHFFLCFRMLNLSSTSLIAKLWFMCYDYIRLTLQTSHTAFMWVSFVSIPYSQFSQASNHYEYFPRYWIIQTQIFHEYCLILEIWEKS